MLSSVISDVTDSDFSVSSVVLISAGVVVAIAVVVVAAGSFLLQPERAINREAVSKMDVSFFMFVLLLLFGFVNSDLSSDLLYHNYP